MGVMSGELDCNCLENYMNFLFKNILNVSGIGVYVLMLRYNKGLMNFDNNFCFFWMR